MSWTFVKCLVYLIGFERLMLLVNHSFFFVPLITYQYGVFNPKWHLIFIEYCQIRIVLNFVCFHQQRL